MKDIFQDARHAAEGEIYTKLNQKIDEFIQLADYEWGMAESDGRASGYLMDLINFLRSTFQVFTHLPVSLFSFPKPTSPLWELWDFFYINLSCFQIMCGRVGCVFLLIIGMWYFLIFFFPQYPQQFSAILLCLSHPY